jgi:hypothetical protein
MSRTKWVYNVYLKSFYKLITCFHVSYYGMPCLVFQPYIQKIFKSFHFLIQYALGKEIVLGT